MSVPNWLNKEFIQKCLYSSRCDSQLSVVKWNISYGFNAKKCFTSGLFRVKLLLKNGQNEEETLSLFFKCTKERSVMSTLMDDNFLIEKYMFANVLPRVEKLLSAAGYLGNFYPSCIYSDEEPVHFLMLEDLAESCHEISRTRGGLDLQHCLLVIETMAKYHAATAVILQNDSKIIPVLKESVKISEPFENKYKHMFPRVAMSIAKCALESHGFPDDLLHRLNNFNESIFGKVREVAVYRNNKFNVILHGDSWKNNYMFKYIQDTVESVKFVDFQASFVSSPAYDLMHFIYSSFSDDDFENCVELLVWEYHKQLSQTLELLGYGGNPYTLNDLKDDMKEFIVVGAYAAMFVQAWALTNESDGIDMNKAVEDMDEVHMLYKNAFLHKIFRFKLAKLIENGLL